MSDYQITALSDVYDALNWLETMIQTVDSRNLATNNSDYTDCKHARIALQRGKEAYKKLVNNHNFGKGRDYE